MNTVDGSGGNASLVAAATEITFAYPGQPPLLAHWSARIHPGVTWVGGDESAGKTTLLRLLAGELAPQAGTLQVRGSVFWVDPRSDGADALLPAQCFDRVGQAHPALDRALLDDLVEAFGLAPHLAKRLDMLSTGSRRKVWLVAAFASGARLTLLDQPYAALDKAAMGLVSELLQDAAQHATRAWVVADYEAPRGVQPLHRILLGPVA